MTKNDYFFLKEGRKSNLENMVTEIEVVKSPEPIVTPKYFHGSTSTRNPGSIIYNGKPLLLITVRDSAGISRIHVADNLNGNGKSFHIRKDPFINTDPDSLLGTEDARAVYDPISEKYLVTFTAFKEILREKQENVTRIGLVTTRDFKTIDERRIILDEFANNKDCVIFPNADSKEYWVFHRPFHGGPVKDRPGIRVAKSKDLINYTDMADLIKPREGMWDGARIGMNTPPIRVRTSDYNEALFMLYHGADEKKNTYRMSYVLLDPNNPLNLLERSELSLIAPDRDFEIGKGNFPAEVNNVVFGNGIIPIGKNKIRLYYGGGDRYIGFADLTFKNAEVLDPVYELVKEKMGA
ncbi:MAG: hypothetical protein KKB62_01640 [Nanoarchaeota archaeon]|nr:hypothetical protein [Nanoarchaeota archaeon]